MDYRIGSIIYILHHLCIKREREREQDRESEGERERVLIPF